MARFVGNCITFMRSGFFSSQTLKSFSNDDCKLVVTALKNAYSGGESCLVVQKLSEHHANLASAGSIPEAHSKWKIPKNFHEISKLKGLPFRGFFLVYPRMDMRELELEMSAFEKYSHQQYLSILATSGDYSGGEASVLTLQNGFASE
ncbi:hypothetical protein Tco_0304298 [Tanacetum coccineum]